MTNVHFAAGTPETVLPELAPEVAAALEHAWACPPSECRERMRTIATKWPRCLDAWAALAELSDDPLERYAFARVGYHRGLDALRAAGWRGSGLVRWSHPSNRGFLRSLAALGEAARAIGETDEAVRCETFLQQLDPDRRR